MNKNAEYQRRYRERHPEWAAYHRQWREAHPERIKEYNRTYTVKTRAEKLAQRERAKVWCLSIAKINGGNACAVCGEADPDVLDFHHRDRSSKKFCISAVKDIPRHEDVAMVMAEIAKCEVLCANCHRKVHRAGPVVE